MYKFTGRQLQIMHSRILELETNNLVEIITEWIASQCANQALAGVMRGVRRMSEPVALDCEKIASAVELIRLELNRRLPKEGCRCK